MRVLSPTNEVMFFLFHTETRHNTPASYLLLTLNYPLLCNICIMLIFVHCLQFVHFLIFERKVLVIDTC